MQYDDAQAHEFAQSMEMLVYYVYLLKKGPAWTAKPSPELDALQAAHIANLDRLREEGKLVINGPLLDSFQLSGELRGIGALKAETMAQARDWISTDPMVKAGHMVFELHAWMIRKDILP